MRWSVRRPKASGSMSSQWYCRLVHIWSTNVDQSTSTSTRWIMTPTSSSVATQTPWPLLGDSSPDSLVLAMVLSRVSRVWAGEVVSVLMEVIITKVLALIDHEEIIHHIFNDSGY